MKILYLSRGYCTHDHRFLAAMRAGGHEVFYARLEGVARQVEDRPVPEGVEIVHWAGGSGVYRRAHLPRLVTSLRRVIRRIRPDLIHAGPIQDVGLVATLSGFRPRLIMSWGFDLMQDADLDGWNRRATRFVLRRADFFLSDCEATRARAVAFGLNPDRSLIFPWGVDLAHFAPAANPSHNPDEFVVFCNRSWEPRYGVDVLARAFVQALRQRPRLRLFLLGGGSQAGALRAILAPVMDRVHFGGQVPQADLPRYYHQADLFVSPSHVDGSPVSLLEAMACGLPVLVSDIPANREWVEHGVNGWLFPDGDVNALTSALIRAVDERDSLPALGRAARRTAEARADWNVNAQKLLEAYRLTVGRSA